MTEDLDDLSLKAAGEKRRQAKTDWDAKVASARASVTIPPCLNPEAVVKQREDLLFFLQHFFPSSTGLKPFGEVQIKAIKAMEEFILRGGRLSLALPRGFAKTSIMLRAQLWAVLNGYRQYAAMFGAAEENAKNLIDALQQELSENKELLDAFPWLKCFWALEGKAARCASQTVAGELTHTVWRSEKVVMPTIRNVVPDGWPMDEWPIDGCPFSGSLFHAKAMRSARGLQFTTPDGEILRPDLICLDDIQTDEDAKSPLQVRKIVEKVKKGILRSVGHAKPAAVINTCTVIEADDVAEQFLNDKSFYSIRFKMVGEMPTEKAMELWEGPYQELLVNYDMDDPKSMRRAKVKARKFYEENREAMDEGAVVGWDWCYEWGDDVPEEGGLTEVSALQHAMNIMFLEGPHVFATECQNDTNAIDGRVLLTEKLFLAKVNEERPPLYVSRASEWIIAFIDVQMDLLWHAVSGVSPTFGGEVCSWGPFPESRAQYVTTGTASPKLSDVYKHPSSNENIWAGLEDLCSRLMATPFVVEDGDSVQTRMGCDLILIDSGFETQTINQFCHRFRNQFPCMPTHGVGIGPRQIPMAEGAEVKKGERRGWHWEVRFCGDKTAASKWQKYLRIDSNHFKTLVHERFLANLGSHSSWEICDHGRQRNLLLCDHTLSEKPELEDDERSMRKVDVWTPRDFVGGSGVENHMFDCLVGIAAGASMLGASLKTVIQRPKKRKRSPKDGKRIRGQRR